VEASWETNLVRPAGRLSIALGQGVILVARRCGECTGGRRCSKGLAANLLGLADFHGVKFSVRLCVEFGWIECAGLVLVAGGSSRGASAASAATATTASAAIAASASVGEFAYWRLALTDGRAVAFGGLREEVGKWAAWGIGRAW
jgi:hypothetical protein